MTKGSFFRLALGFTALVVSPFHARSATVPAAGPQSYPLCNIPIWSDRIDLRQTSFGACAGAALRYYGCNRERALVFYFNEREYALDIDDSVYGPGRGVNVRPMASLDPEASRICGPRQPAALIRGGDGGVEYRTSDFVTRCGPSVGVGGRMDLDAVPPASPEISTDRLIEIGLQYGRAMDDVPAAVCMIKAARRGDERAMFYLGNLYGGRSLYDLDAKRSWLALAEARAIQTGNTQIRTRARAELDFEEPTARDARRRRAEAMMGFWTSSGEQPDPYEVRCMMRTQSGSC